jgi:osmotically-inducible protein OsmY
MPAGPLLHRIDSAIRSNPFVLHRRVFLEDSQGRVTLRGRVDSYYQKQMVQEVLRGMEGIAEISNELEVEEYATS